MNKSIQHDVGKKEKTALLLCWHLDCSTCQARDALLVQVIGGGEVSKLGRQIRIEHPGVVGVDAERVAVRVRSAYRSRGSENTKTTVVPRVRRSDCPASVACGQRST